MTVLRRLVAALRRKDDLSPRAQINDHVRIVGGGQYDGGGTAVYLQDGRRLDGVSEVVISPLRVGDLLTATITVPCTIGTIHAVPFMSEASFLEAAKVYGYRVEKLK